MEEQRPRLFYVLFFPTVLVALLWLVKLFEVHLGLDFSHFGIKPRDVSGLLGILTGPLVHGDWFHLLDNSVPLLLLLAGIFYFYRPVAWRVVAWAWLMTGFWVWAAARPSCHIGASGLIYGFASFIFFSGIIRKYPRLIALSLLVVFLYGGMVWGVFPIKTGVSWESHLLGAVAGLLIAINYRHQGPSRKRFDWELEEAPPDLPPEAGQEQNPPPGSPESENDEPPFRYTYRKEE